MNRTVQIAPVQKMVVVEASAARAFEVFTDGIDRWWPKSMGIGATPIRKSQIEPFVGGRWYTTHEDGSEVALGHILTWIPGECFAVTWEINAQNKPDTRLAFTSEVEVRFIAETASRTRIEVEHRNFERMGATDGEKMRGGVEHGWPVLLKLFATEVANQSK